MPRIARPHTAAIRESQALVRQYLAAPGNNQADLARAAGVAPYTVSRLLSGRIKDTTPDVRRVVAIANNGNTLAIPTLCGDARLARVVGGLWDGTDERLHRLADALEPAGPLPRLLTGAAAARTSAGSE